jgi:hypothetical protein
MKIRQANGNKGNPSLVVGIPSDMKKQMGIGLGSEVMWRLNETGRWELMKMEVSDTEEIMEFRRKYEVDGDG